MLSRLLLGLVALYLVSSATSPLLNAQTEAAQPQITQSQMVESAASGNERDIAARKKALLSESSDLEEMAKTLSGTEFDVNSSLDARASQGAMELDAVFWFLAVYDRMQCDADRETAKVALKNRLGFYSYVLGLEADQAAGQLAFARLPATAQAGARIKDALRAAKNKLDEIAASLK
jgi:hypothetical protein